MDESDNHLRCNDEIDERTDQMQNRSVKEVFDELFGPSNSADEEQNLETINPESTRQCGTHEGFRPKILFLLKMNSFKIYVNFIISTLAVCVINF